MKILVNPGGGVAHAPGTHGNGLLQACLGGERHRYEAPVYAVPLHPTVESMEQSCLKWGQDVLLPGCCVFRGLPHYCNLQYHRPVRPPSTKAHPLRLQYAESRCNHKKSGFLVLLNLCNCSGCIQTTLDPSLCLYLGGRPLPVQ